MRTALRSGDIQRLILAADQKRVRHVPLENVLALEKVCQDTGGLQGELQGGLSFIFPGTRWCGPGKISSAQCLCSLPYHRILHSQINRFINVRRAFVIVVNLIIEVERAK